MGARMIRGAVVKSIVDTLEVATDADVKVHRWFPGEQNASARMVWLDELRSDHDVPVAAGATRMHRDDIFDMTLKVWVVGKSSEGELTDKTDRVFADIEDRVAGNDMADDIAGVLSVVVTSSEYSCGRTQEGFLGTGEIVLQVHTRLT